MSATNDDMAGFLPVRLEALASGRPLPFDVYLYFEANRHRIKWRSAGDQLLPDDVRLYRRRGLSGAWLRAEEQERLRDFSGASRARTPEASRLIALLVDPREAAALAEESRRILALLFNARSVEEQDEAYQRFTPLLFELLGACHSHESRVAQSLLLLAEQFPEIEHAPRVALLSVLLLLSFHDHDPAEAPLVALAALLHDVGRTECRTEDSAMMHAERGASIVQDLLPESIPSGSPEVQKLIREHHEFMDGTGVHQLRDDQLSTRSQLLSLAELLETEASPGLPAKRSTLRETLARLESSGSARALQGKFSPAILVPLFQWTGVQPGSPESG
jgi:hypothetical protein